MGSEYKVGTLTYTKRGLIVLFIWMLWGDFCFTLMESVVPSILPIRLKALGASNATMALIMSTLPGILNVSICPWVSFTSDRYRSRWGRRLPFILWTLPFLTVFLILLGFSDGIGIWVHRLAFADSGRFSTATVTVAIIGVFMVCFQFFNMFVNSVYWYFFNDVVPQHCIGQFLGLFRVVGGLAGALYNMFVFKYAESHMTAIFLGAALVYGIGFGAMCLRVREGEYPPPPAYSGGREGMFAGIRTFFTECFSLRFYWFMFGMTTFSSLCGCANIFNIFFLRNVGISLEQYGTLAGYAGLIGMVLTYPAGMIADKYHPLRVQLAMQLVMLLIMPLNLVFLLVGMSPATAYHYYIVTSLIALPAGALATASSAPTEMRIFPRERYGQFCSAQAMVRSVGTIAGGLAAGLVFDILKRYYGGSDFAYRWIPAWVTFFQMLSVICMIQVYRGWKSYGGEYYVAPLRANKPGTMETPAEAYPGLPPEGVVEE